MPPLPTMASPNQPTVTVTLRVLNKNDACPTRILRLQDPDYYFMVGRSSKSVEQPLPAAENTAWFDSRVMSRQHAMVLADPQTKTLTIQDTNSMHGIWRNGYQVPACIEHSIVNGDVLTFGVNVERNTDSFQAVSVKFEYEWNHEVVDLISPTGSPVNTPSRTYAVPDGSDVDEFDGDDARSLEEFASRSEGAEDRLLRSSQTFAVPDSDQSDVTSAQSDVEDDGYDHTNTSPSLSGPAEPEQNVQEPKPAPYIGQGVLPAPMPTLVPTFAQSARPTPISTTGQRTTDRGGWNGEPIFVREPPVDDWDDAYASDGGFSDDSRDYPELPGFSYWSSAQSLPKAPVPTWEKENQPHIAACMPGRVPDSTTRTQQPMWSPFADRPPYPTYPEPQAGPNEILNFAYGGPLPPSVTSALPPNTALKYPEPGWQSPAALYAAHQACNVQFNVPISKPEEYTSETTPKAAKSSLKRKADSISSMDVEVPETIAIKFVVSGVGPSQPAPVADVVESVEPSTSKKARVEADTPLAVPALRQRKSTSNLSTLAATAMTGVVVGAVGTLFGLASLPQTYFA